MLAALMLTVVCKHAVQVGFTFSKSEIYFYLTYNGNVIRSNIIIKLKTLEMEADYEK